MDALEDLWNVIVELIDGFITGLTIFVERFLTTPSWWLFAAVCVAIAVGVPWAISRTIKRTEQRQ